MSHDMPMESAHQASVVQVHIKEKQWRQNDADREERDARKREAEAEAEARILRGEADAFSVEAKAKAEAEKMAKKADAWKEYKEAAMLDMMLEAMPKVRLISSITFQEPTAVSSC